jgi:conjugal transfer pilus assembly protein TraW
MMRAMLMGVFLVLPSMAWSEDLGARGKTVVVDRDGRQQMKDLVREKEASGDLARFWRDYQSKVVDAIKHPAPLGVPSETRFRTELHDLRFVLPQDYRDHTGRVVARRGTVIEPLKIQPLTTGLIFIDGRDESQVQYALAAGRKERLKIVLTAGSPFDLRVRFRNVMWNGSPTVPFYFDQRKLIINQLQRLYGIQLRSVPAKLTQQGSQLQIEFGMRQ